MTNLGAIGLERFRKAGKDKNGINKGECGIAMAQACGGKGAAYLSRGIPGNPGPRRFSSASGVHRTRTLPFRCDLVWKMRMNTYFY
jgi:hypothetical protein